MSAESVGELAGVSGARVDSAAVEVQMARSSIRARLFGHDEKPIRLGRFVVMGRLGAGGMGVVYEAYDPELDRKVALKLLRTDTRHARRTAQESRASLDALGAEAKAMARLSHPNVVTIFDVGEVDGRLYIAMEYVPPPTLRVWLSAEHSVEEVVEVLLQAGRGLAAAHRAGLVHRDFKPENVVVPEEGPVRVMDFGLARSLGRVIEDLDHTRDGAREVLLTTQLAGTPQYMAPEQLELGLIDARADQWAFCVTLYESLFGRVPSAADGLGSAAGLQIPREARGSALPERVIEALRRGSSTDPEARFESMEALLDALGPKLNRTRTRALPWVALTVAVGLVVGAVFLPRGSASEDPCPHQEQRVAALWGEAQAQQLRARFGATNLGYAEQSASRVVEIFNTYGQQWIAAERSICLRGIEHTPNSPYVCLDGHLEAWAITLELLIEGEDEELATTIERSVSLASRLPSVHECEHPTASSSLDPLNADERRELRRHTNRAQVRLQARQLEAAQIAVETARRELSTIIAHTEVDASLSLVEAELAVLRAQPQVALERLDHVVELAAQDHALDLIARASVMQAEVEGGLEADSDAARDLLRVARIALATSAAGPQLYGQLELVQARVEYDGNHFDAGRRATEAAIAAFEQAGERGRLNLGEGLQLLAIQAFGAGDYARSRELADQALALQVELLGDAHPDLAKTALVLGALELIADHSELAVLHFERAATLQAQSLGTAHPSYGQTLVNLGNAHVDLGELESALAEYQRGRAILEGALGDDDPRVVACLVNIGGTHRGLGDPEAAEMVFRQAIVRSRTLGEAGANSLALATANLARALQDQERMGEADEAYREALRLRESVFGTDHPKTATIYDALGRFLVETGAVEEGAEWVEAGLEVREARLGPDHPDLAQSLVSSALVQLARDQPTVAVQTLERALAILEDGGRSDLRGDARWHLAWALTERGQPGDLDRARVQLAESRTELEASPYAVASLLAWCEARDGASPCD